MTHGGHPLHLAPLLEAEAARMLSADNVCIFNRSPKTDPVLCVHSDGGGDAIKLNGVLVRLENVDETRIGTARLFGPGATVALRPLD